MQCLGPVIRCWAHDYIFVHENRTWVEAQRYCRENYSDLATVWSEWDLWELCAEELNCTGAWIGLNNQQRNRIRKWHWSQVGQEYTERPLRWRSEKTSDQQEKMENCVSIHSDLSLSLQSCCSTQQFICYDDRSNISEVIHRSMTWSEALHFCRQMSVDLLSGWSQLLDPVLKDKIQAHEDSSWWVGLFRDPWTWSNLTSSFRHWHHQHGFMCGNASFTDGQCARVGPKGTWTTANCTEKNPFICYDPKPLKLTLVRQNLTWEEASAYCAHNHSRLLSITSRGQQTQAEQAARQAHSEAVWLGAHYTCLLDLWLWSNGEFMVFKQWSKPEEESQCGQAAAMGRGGKWVKKDQVKRYNFICVQ